MSDRDWQASLEDIEKQLELESQQVSHPPPTTSKSSSTEKQTDLDILESLLSADDETNENLAQKNNNNNAKSKPSLTQKHTTDAPSQLSDELASFSSKLTAHQLSSLRIHDEEQAIQLNNQLEQELLDLVAEQDPQNKTHPIEPPAERLLRWAHESEEYSESELSSRFKSVYNLYQYSRKEAHHDHHRLRFILQQLDIMSSKLLATDSLEDMDKLSEGYADYYYNLKSLDEESKQELYQQHYAHLDTAYIGSGFWRTQINELDSFVHPTDGQHLDEHYHDVIHAKHSLFAKEMDAQQQQQQQPENPNNEDIPTRLTN